MIEHIWIEDKVDWGNFHRYYKDITVRWKGGAPIEAVATYQGIDTKVHFYTVHQANNHLRYKLWCGIHVQKVIINEVINVDSFLYLISRLRSDTHTNSFTEHHKELLVAELIAGAVYIDWLEEDNGRSVKNFSDFKGRESFKDFVYGIL